VLDASSSARVVRFGVFELDLHAGELRKAGVRLPLQGQPLEVLAALVECPGQLVTRDQLRQRLWPGDTFVDFDHGLSAAVNRLREVLGDSAGSPRFVETLPRRGYRFIAPVTWDGDHSTGGPVVGTPSPEPPPSGIGGSPVQVPTPWFGFRGNWVARCLVVLVGLAAVAAVGLGRSSRRAPPESAGAEPPMHVVPVTTLSGVAGYPTLSPDGSAVAFTWMSGKIHDGASIYATAVGSGTATRVTVSPDRDIAPSWSPDGRHIAFIRHETPESLWTPGSPWLTYLYVTSPFGGGARKVSDLSVGYVSWSPDSRFLVAVHDSGMPDPLTGIYLIPLSGGGSRRIVATAAQTHDGNPIFSPDGRRLAYVTCQESVFACDIHVVDLNADWLPVGTPRRVARPTRDGIFGMSWTEDGRELVYSTERRPYLHELWRVSLDGTRAPEAIDVAGVGATDPAIGRARHRLAFARGHIDTDIYRFEAGRAPQPVLTSSLADSDQDYSPDGTRIVFVSVRSGDAAEIWVAKADGSDAHELTHLSLRWLGSPRWSPDGRRIAFEAVDDAHHFRVWTIDADGGTARPLTGGPGNEYTPTWSADGTYVYYSAIRGEPRGIWRIPSAGGAPQQVTKTDSCCWMELEGSSGRYVVYADNEKLLLLPPGGGAARQLVACAHGFTIAAYAVYYVGCEASDSPSIHRLDVLTGRDQKLGVLPGFGGFGRRISVSPDGRSILYTKVMPGTGADIMLIENFR
jgi:Tol biopolymer transport system component/DNA-binding winged helix-turn-helix (wHTH) protein